MANMSDDDPKLSVVQGAEKAHGPVVKLLRERLFGVDSKSVFGSGLDMGEYFQTLDFLRYQRCIVTQPKYEQRRRMEYILRLSVEHAAIVAQDRFSTAWSEACIESIIEGNWEDLRIRIGMLTFDDERVVGARPAWAELARTRFVRFVEIATEALEGRPKVYCPLCVKPLDPERLHTFFDGRHECQRCDVVFDDDGTTTPRDRARLTTVDGGEP
jgi:hypothetical protein